jgi:hypothetical protein
VNEHFTIQNETSAGSFVVTTNSTTALTIDSNQDTTLSGDLTVTGGDITLGDSGSPATTYIRDSGGDARISLANAGGVILRDLSGGAEFSVNNGFAYVYGYLTVATAGSTIAQEAWTAVSYGTGWADYSVGYLGVSYMKDSLGFIHIRGMAKKTSGTADLVFTLPAGYRPANRLIFSAQAYDYGTGYTYGRVDVQTNGKVTVENPGTLAVGDWVSFGAINFDTQAEP